MSLQKEVYVYVWVRCLWALQRCMVSAAPRRHQRKRMLAPRIAGGCLVYLSMHLPTAGIISQLSTPAFFSHVCGARPGSGSPGEGGRRKEDGGWRRVPRANLVAGGRASLCRRSKLNLDVIYIFNSLYFYYPQGRTISGDAWGLAAAVGTHAPLTPLAVSGRRSSSEVLPGPEKNEGRLPRSLPP